MKSIKKEADFFFELSWEVCNKVGGIYTVITSKIQQMLKHYKFNYYTIGPYFPEKNITDKFKLADPPKFLKESFEKLHLMGIKCHFGKWLVDGEPNTILIDYSDYTYKVNEIKGQLWDNYQIDSMNSKYHDFDEPMIWSTCAGILLEEIKKRLPSKKIVLQCHEWMAGGALLHLKSVKSKVGTVFTTHATMLGRTLSANNVDLYGQLENLNPKEEAYKYGIPEKFLAENACANAADAFTTVSEITAIEATHFFGIQPDVILCNGLDTKVFPTFDDVSVKHKLLKNKVKKFLKFYFFPYYSFDLDDTLIFFLAGRYEYQNKGVDVYIEALGKLNEELKKKKSNKTIIAFIWVPAGVKEIKPEIMENRTFYEDIEDSVQDGIEGLKDRVIYGLLGKKPLNEEFLLGKDLVKQTEKRLARFAKKGNPPICTHNLYNEQNEQILNAIKHHKLNNSKEDRVKMIFYPIYLTGADRLTDLNYYEAIMASHLGVFPSYYEPWGYTPMETGGLGVASVTTDLAGFGRYIHKKSQNKKNPGIYVLERQDKPYNEIVTGLFNIFKRFVGATKQDRIENKLKAKNLADLADWNILADNYIKAHNLAVSKNK
jgi:glycogen synthase